MINRRDAIKRIGGMAGAAAMAKFLPACKSGDDGPVGITTYVYLMMENRSYDHYLGGRALVGKGGDGLTSSLANDDVNGTPVAPYEPTPDEMCGFDDPPHGWAELHASWNNGANDGFLTSFQNDDSTTATSVMEYMTATELPVSWALADAYTSCDRWFCSLLGPTLPNRMYWHCASSFGIGPDQTTTDSMGNTTTTDANSLIIDQLSSGSPVPSVYNKLEDAGVDWAYYWGNFPVVGLIAANGPYKIADAPSHIKMFGDYQGAAGQFFTDAAAGKLPPVVYIDPFFYVNDDHPPVHPIYGQQLIAAVYTALAKSPQWKNCMLVITYDENGGFYDHVGPPATQDDTDTNPAITAIRTPVAGFDQMGIRVPTLVVGPYAKQNYVSSTVYDHTSAIKHLQNVFGLENMNPRTEAANDLTDCIDMDRLEKGDWAPPVTLPAIDLSDFPQADSGPCLSNETLIFKDPISKYADEHPGFFTPGVTDRRDGVSEYLRGIRKYLRENMNTYPTTKPEKVG